MSCNFKKSTGGLSLGNKFHVGDIVQVSEVPVEGTFVGWMPKMDKCCGSLAEITSVNKCGSGTFYRLAPLQESGASELQMFSWGEDCIFPVESDVEQADVSWFNSDGILELFGYSSG